MGKLQDFFITLDCGGAPFCEGQVISGHVTVDLAAPLETRGVTLKIVGFAHVYFADREQGIRTKNKENGITSFTATEEYFRYTSRLFGAADPIDYTCLPQGKHKFPFKYTLPSNLPASFDGDHGYVRYHCKATLNKPWKFDATCKTVFTVIPRVDLNLDPSVMNPVYEGVEKMLCCWCWKTGPVSASVSLSRTGYVSGECIYLMADVENFSNKAMIEAKASLNQIVTYTTTQKTRSELNEIYSTSLGKLSAGAVSYWESVAIPIPTVPPTSMQRSIVDVQYTLDFDIVPPSPSNTLNVSVPLVIGTVPLHSTGSSIQVPTPPPYSETPPPGELPLSPEEFALPMYPDLPPPAYMECAVGERGLDYEDSFTDEQSVHSSLSLGSQR